LILIDQAISIETDTDVGRGARAERFALDLAIWLANVLRPHVVTLLESLVAGACVRSGTFAV